MSPTPPPSQPRQALPEAQPARPVFFSIIVPTRDRPVLLREALDSVLAQDFDDFEVLVVNDSRAGTAVLQAQLGELPDKVRLISLTPRERGHGPAYARNHGASLSNGQYLCFLDDDDAWIDSGHLRRAAAAIRASAAPIDLYFTHQRAVFSDGRENTAPLWLAGLERLCAARPDAAGHRVVSLADLLRAPGFAHLNCSIYRRALYDAIGGMDETLRYENDRDVYLRAVDRAATIVYNPAIVSLHHIPDAARHDNVSTAVTQLEKKLFQLRICDKAILHARQDAMRAHARRSKGHTLKAIAEVLVARGQQQEATYYMREALMVAFSLKWLGYTVLHLLRARGAARAGQPGPVAGVL